ncbi:hypothetical protein TNCV_2134081 [Trichonephila clavipes]|nr:hypothetical protein TNCV_2134081 [Trichonephila clavipes]
MSGVKKKLSGSQKRKIRKEKEYNINIKCAKLDNFLISASSSSCASASSSNARELDEQGQAHPGIHKRRIWMTRERGDSLFISISSSESASMKFFGFEQTQNAFVCFHVELCCIIRIPPGQPIGVNVHCTQHPIREQSLSSQPSQKNSKTFHPDEEPQPRLSDSIARPIAIMPLSRMENITFAMPSIIDSHDMGLRTVYSPDARN